MKYRFKTYWKHFKPFSLIFLPFFLIGLIVGAYPGYRTYEYVWKDPAFCVSCHVHDYASFAWQGSAHGRLTTCHDCHHQPLHAYMWEPIALMLYHTKFPRDLKHTPHVPQDLCESCHVSGHDSGTVTGPLSKADIAKIPKIDHFYLHRIHLEAKTDRPLVHELDATESVQFVKNVMMDPNPKLPDGQKRKITCTDCHGGPTNRAHDFSATDLACVRCHSEQHKSRIAAQHGCRSCHFQEFLTRSKEK